MVSSQSIRGEIFNQLHTAHEGATEFLLKSGNSEHVTTVEEMGEQLTDWVTDERVDYIQKQHSMNNVDHTLCARPSIALLLDSVPQIADAYNKSNNSDPKMAGAYIWNGIWSRQTHSQIVGLGEVSIGGYDFSLVPDCFSPKMREKPLEQRKMLAEQRYDNPHVELAVPSVAEAIVRWGTLRARGAKDSIALSSINHFDTTIPRINGWSPALFSYIWVSGMPYITGNNANTKLNARIALK